MMVHMIVFSVSSSCSLARLRYITHMFGKVFCFFNFFIEFWRLYKCFLTQISDEQAKTTCQKLFSIIRSTFTPNSKGFWEFLPVDIIIMAKILLKKPIHRCSQHVISFHSFGGLTLLYSRRWMRRGGSLVFIMIKQRWRWFSIHPSRHSLVDVFAQKIVVNNRFCWNCILSTCHRKKIFYCFVFPFPNFNHRL